MLRVSVCLASFNGEKFIAQQIDSILRQLSSSDELIISDDGSTDQTLSILDQYREDRRVRFINGPGQGLIKNFEYAIGQAKGEIIFLADQDDIWLPNKVETMRAIFLNQPGIEVIISDLKVVDENLEIVENSYFELKRVRTGVFKNILRNTYIGAGMAFRSSLREKILPFPQNIPMHDMWIGLMAKKHVLLLDQQLTLYRRHGANNSQIETTSSWAQKVKWRYVLVKNLIIR